VGEGRKGWKLSADISPELENSIDPEEKVLLLQ
jgi:hypothetical protein